MTWKYNRSAVVPVYVSAYAKNTIRVTPFRELFKGTLLEQYSLLRVLRGEAQAQGVHNGYHDTEASRTENKKEIGLCSSYTIPYKPIVKCGEATNDIIKLILRWL